MIHYDKQTTPLLSHIHRITGVVRTGRSQRVRNLGTVLQLERNPDALDLHLGAAVDTIRTMAGGLEIGVPELYEFEVAGRELTCIHGIVEIKRKFAVDYEYRFVVVYRDEVFRVMEREFKMTQARWTRLLKEKLTA